MIIVCLGFVTLAQAQVNIIKVEYFVDVDPGVGLATDVPVVPAPTVDINFTIPPQPAGFHTLVVRSQDANLDWSVQESRSFYVSTSDITSTANIVALEYFIDTDPTPGSGTVVPITIGSTIDVDDIANTAALPVGHHTIYVRALDSDGLWGEVESRSFYVSASDLTTISSVVAIEYFIDTDPGVGSGTIIPITPGQTVDEAASIATSALPSGHHTMYMRAMDSDGIWGEVESRYFFIDDFGSSLIDGIEYFIDTDPGTGAGTQIDLNPDVAALDSTINFNTSALSSGGYTIGFRTFNANGVFGQTEFYAFTICDGALPSVSADMVCVGTATTFTDNSTGVLGGDIFSWDFDSDGFEDSNSPGNQTFTYPTAGTYTASLSIDRAGCVTSSTITVLVADFPVVNAGIDQAVCSNAATLSATALPLEVGVWNVISGSPSIADNTSPSTTITLSNGINELEWLLTDSTGTCMLADTVVFDLRVVTIANAGPDQSVCSDTVTFSANSPAINETGTWSLLAGAGTIAGVNNPNTQATGLSASSSFIWEIEDQLANCISRDTIQVSSSQPINAIDQSVIVGIGDSIILPLASIVAGNPGDSFTTTITAQGSKGMATALVNGDLQFNPSVGFLGADMFDFEVCNQCGSCSTGTVTVDIPNLAPTVLVDSSTLVVDNTNPQLTLDLSQFISDPNNNIDISSFRIVTQPASGAVASIDNGVLTLDYTGITFDGTDQFSIEICDTSGACATQLISFQVNVVATGQPREPGSIIVYNAVSPNGDGRHDFFNIIGITDFLDNVVTIYSKNGSLVFDQRGYNNAGNAFVGNDNSGTELPNGTYYYHIQYGGQVATGYLLLTR